MGKTVSAADMLSAGRRRQPASATSEPLDDSTSSDLVVTAPRHLDAEAAGPSVERPTYQRQTVFLRPDQRRWLKETMRHIEVDGLSQSDLVRLALDHLRQDVDTEALEVSLVELLTSQAHEEAKKLTGRRNRGLPQRLSD
jgi:hypothetical protein